MTHTGLSSSIGCFYICHTLHHELLSSFFAVFRHPPLAVFSRGYDWPHYQDVKDLQAVSSESPPLSRLIILAKVHVQITSSPGTGGIFVVWRAVTPRDCVSHRSN